MVTLKYSESPIESRELLKKSITFLGAHQLSANPINHTVCYEYLLGTHILLIQEINQAIIEKKPLTDQMLENWFEKFLLDYNLNSLRQSQAELIEVIKALGKSTTLAEENVADFGRTLQKSENELVNPSNPID